MSVGGNTFNKRPLLLEVLGNFPFLPGAIVVALAGGSCNPFPQHSGNFTYLDLPIVPSAKIRIGDADHHAEWFANGRVIVAIHAGDSFRIDKQGALTYVFVLMERILLWKVEPILAQTSLLIGSDYFP